MLSCYCLTTYHVADVPQIPRGSVHPMPYLSVALYLMLSLSNISVAFTFRLLTTFLQWRGNLFGSPSRASSCYTRDQTIASPDFHQGSLT
jgi:hypothetical protein